MGQNAKSIPVFLIEDNPVIRANLVSTMVELANVRIVGEASSEREATEWLQSHPDDWQMVVIDLFLSQGSGLGVLRACRNRRGDQKAIVLSNFATPEMRARCDQLGADATFDKSTEVEDFIAFCNHGRSPSAG